MQNTDQLLTKYRDMVRSAAWGAAKAWGLDFDDVEAQGYLVFMEATERYEEGRASFSTFLFNRLKTLNDYCEREVKLRGKTMPILEEYLDDEPLNSHKQVKTNTCLNYRVNSDFCASDSLTRLKGKLVNYDDFCSTLNHLESVAKLSMDARDLLNYILMGDWGRPGSDIKPSLFSVQKEYKKKGWKPSRATTAWNELKSWYIATQAA
jgi:hypothetical protein